MAKTLTTNYALGNWEDGDNPGADDLNTNWQTIDEQLWNREREILSLDADVQVDLAALAADFASQRNAVFNARMQLDSATQISLQRFAGSRVSVNGEIITLDSSGLTCSTTAMRIGATGTDAGAALTTNTLYYVYVSNNSATYAPRSLRCSTTAPSSYNGIKYLATSGNGANWRFVGWVRTNGSTQFVDSDTQRFVINYYNRRDLRLLTCPGYNDNNAATTYTEAAAANWKEVNGGTNSRISFIANGEDAVTPIAQLYAEPNDPAVDFWEIGIGRDAITEVRKIASTPYATQVCSGSVTVSDAHVPSEGFHEFLLVIHVPTATTNIVVYADSDRDGSTVDPMMTYIECVIRG